jgi:hypothetical protein
MSAFAVWDHWLVADDGTIAKVFQDPYRVELVFADGRTVARTIPYEKVRVDDALEAQHRAERAAARIGRIGAEPTSWPEFLPPFFGTATFGPDGLLWIPRAVAAGQPPLYDIIDRTARLVERVRLPARHRLVGFGAESVYLVRLDGDDLQYLQRRPLPTRAGHP